MRITNDTRDINLYSEDGFYRAISPRNLDIYERVRGGDTQTHVACLYGISKTRVRLIIDEIDRKVAHNRKRFWTRAHLAGGNKGGNYE